MYYFRVLKNARQSPLLPAVLQGLGRHAHLIDAAFFGDLMKVLKSVMEDRQLGTRITLECVKCGCTLLSGQSGMAVNIDIKVSANSVWLVGNHPRTTSRMFLDSAVAFVPILLVSSLPCALDLYT